MRCVFPQDGTVKGERECGSSLQTDLRAEGEYPMVLRAAELSVADVERLLRERDHLLGMVNEMAVTVITRDGDDRNLSQDVRDHLQRHAAQ